MVLSRERIKPITAIKRYLEVNGKHVPLIEMKNFWTSITSEQKLEYAREAAKQLGVDLDEESK